MSTSTRLVCPIFIAQGLMQRYQAPTRLSSPLYSFTEPCIYRPESAARQHIITGTVVTTGMYPVARVYSHGRPLRNAIVDQHMQTFLLFAWIFEYCNSGPPPGPGGAVGRALHTHRSIGSRNCCRAEIYRFLMVIHDCMQPRQP